MRSAKTLLKHFVMCHKKSQHLYSQNTKSSIYLLYNDGFTIKHKISHLCFPRFYSKRKLCLQRHEK